MIRVALIDDHPLILRILRQELVRCTDIEIVWVATDADKVMSFVAGDPPDVLVLDLAFAGRGFEPVSAVRDLCGRFADMSILILTANDDPTWVEELLKAGARGYVVKSDDLSLRVADAIRTVAQGRTFLSPAAATGLTLAHKKYTLTTRERAILRLAAEGMANPKIAETLGVSDGTVRNHISNIYTKLEVTTREAAIRAAQNLRELPKPGASIRHELRTPLHTLMGLARLLESKLARDGQIGVGDAEMIHLIVSEAERLDGMIEAISE